MYECELHMHESPEVHGLCIHESYKIRVTWMVVTEKHGVT